MTERWLPVIGWEGFYEVSDHGRVRSLARAVTAARMKNTVAVLNLPTRTIHGQTLKTGHVLVALVRDGKRHFEYVHRLVLQAFVGPAAPGLEACHYNGNASDNRLENLRWDTRSSNHIDKVRHGNHYFANRTHCPKGHPYTDENTYRYPNGSRACRTCRLEAQREVARKKKTA